MIKYLLSITITLILTFELNASMNFCGDFQDSKYDEVDIELLLNSISQQYPELRQRKFYKYCVDYIEENTIRIYFEPAGEELKLVKWPSLQCRIIGDWLDERGWDCEIRKEFTGLIYKARKIFIDDVSLDIALRAIKAVERFAEKYPAGVDHKTSENSKKSHTIQPEEFKRIHRITYVRDKVYVYLNGSYRVYTKLVLEEIKCGLDECDFTVHSIL